MRAGALAGALLLLIAAAPAAAFDEALYARLLLRHTRETPDAAGVRVAYSALRADRDWARLVTGLGAASTKVPRRRAGAIAFWINAYNILVIETVARGYPVESIRDLGSPIWPVWKHREIAVAGELRSLDEIEHEILRPMGDPRIHAALVCASVSCPPLAREPWQADRLDEMFDAALSSWLGDARKGLRIDREHGRVFVSKVFDWFADDFGDDPSALLAFVLPHVAVADRIWLSAHREQVEIEYLRYDWRLNDLEVVPAAPDAP